MNELQRTALGWYRQGVSVLPILARRKKAAIRWEALQTPPRPPWPVVAGWFGGRFASRNLALLCGKVSNGLVVLDFDCLDAYEVWAGVHLHHLAQTYQVKTPRPGVHAYLLCDAPPAQTTARQGVDIKATGYVLTPPSRTFDGCYEVLHDAPILRVSSLEVAMVGLEALPSPECSEDVKGEPGGLTLNITGNGATVHIGQPSPNIFGRFGTSQDLRAIRLPSDIVAQVKSAVSILEVARWYCDMQSSDGGAGNWYVGCCPWPGHKDKHPSFSLSLRNGRCNCKVAGCKLNTRLGSDIIDLVSALEGLRFREALAAIGLQVGILELGCE